MAGMTQKYEDGTPIWVDLGTTDVAAAASFYVGLFGWTYEDMGPDSGGYGMFRKDGQLVAGIGPATDPSRGTSWATYFQGDAEEVASRVAANGGQVIVAPMDVMEQGRFAVFTDPAGAFFSVWQPGKHVGAELVNQPGSLSWSELLTTDADAAKAFYAQVLGVGVRTVSMGEGMEYHLLEAGGRAVAGAMQIDPSWGPVPPHWDAYFAVDDTDAVHAKALELGATSATEPQDSPAGRFAAIVDPQGGRFALIKNDPNFSM
jgi:predicted enzyme related to lactoylglutathione lyase